METQTTQKVDVYELVTNRIIERLEAGVIPWKQPWALAGLPRNLITMNPYNGVNILLLCSLGYTRNYFLSFKQVKDLGGSVMKGEKSIPVVFWKTTEREDPVTKEKKKSSFIRYYTVFNVDQCVDIPESKIPVMARTKEINPIKRIEATIKAMPNRPVIRHKEPRAYYDPLRDFINMPNIKLFKDAESYYGTLMHELIHSTGHSSRLNRKELADMNRKEAYSFEELVAEIGECFLRTHLAIENDFDNNVAYIQGWLKRLKDDKKFIIYASAKAQRAVDYILNEVADRVP